MSTVTIDQLPAAAAPTGTELVPVSQGGVTKAMPLSNVGGIAAMPSVAAMRALKVPLKRVYVDSYYGDGAGGDAVYRYDPASVANENGGTVIAAPAIVGRYIRPADGILHSSWFGIKHDGTSGQQPAVQRFITECIQTHKTGFWDPGTIQCDGGPLWFTFDGTRKVTRDGTKNYSAANSNRALGFKFEGATRELSQVHNAYACVNPPTVVPVQPIGGAGGGRFMNWRLYGIFDLFDLQGDCKFDSWQIYDTTYLTLERPYAAADDPTLQFLKGYVGAVVGCNHSTLDTVSLVGIGGETVPANRNGLLVAGCVNFKMRGGLSNGHRVGLTATSIPGTNDDADGNAATNSVAGLSHISIEGTHLEGNQHETIIIENCTSGWIDAHIRPYGWDFANYPAIRLGGTAGAARNVAVMDCYTADSENGGYGATSVNGQFGQSHPPFTAGTFCRFENTQNCTFERNSLTRFAVALSCGPNAKLTDPGKQNSAIVNGTAADGVSAPAPTIMLVAEPGATFVPVPRKGVKVLPSGVANVTFDATGNESLYQLNLSVQGTLQNPKGLLPGDRFEVYVTRATSNAKLTWGSMYAIAGGNPDLSALAVGSSYLFRLTYDGTTLIGTNEGAFTAPAAPTV